MSSTDKRLAKLERDAAAGDQDAAAKVQAERDRAGVRPPITVGAKPLKAGAKTAADLAQGLLEGSLSDKDLARARELWSAQG